LKQPHCSISITAMFHVLRIREAALMVFLARCICLDSARADKVDDYVAEQMQQRHVPGLCLAVVQEGRPVAEKGYGRANLELNTPVTTNTVFEIGSITKQFTAALVMMLADERRVALDDPIEQHLKDTPEIWQGMTIRHLLTHTSGLKSYTGLDGFEVRRKLDYEAFARELAKEPLEFKPGERFSYCNSGYNLLGYLIEQKSGTSYWALLRERILVPLSMKHTRDRDTKSVIANRAAGYELQAGELVNRDSDLTDVFAAGAMVSTVPDLVKWNAALDAGVLLSTDNLKQMWTPVTLNNGKEYPYGFGWRVQDDNDRHNIGHSGSTSGFSASLQRFPREHLAVIVLCNLGQQDVATKIARGVAELYFTTPCEAGGDTKP
jgi:D-alanyl-D-alanine carboxypeptidase